MITGADKEITYRMLRDWIDSLPERKKDVPVHICPPHCHTDDALPLACLTMCGTVDELFGDDPDLKTRSHLDNGHHPGMPVLLWDWNMFYPDGSMAEDLETGEKIFPTNVPKVEV